MEGFVTYRHRGCRKPVHVEVEPGYEFNEWVMVCACGEHLHPDGYELEAMLVPDPPLGTTGTRIR